VFFASCADSELMTPKQMKQKMARNIFFIVLCFLVFNENGAIKF
jgi:hypothetical protein